jgi:hypothetical protein
MWNPFKKEKKEPPKSYAQITSEGMKFLKQEDLPNLKEGEVYYEPMSYDIYNNKGELIDDTVRTFERLAKWLHDFGKYMNLEDFPIESYDAEIAAIDKQIAELETKKQKLEYKKEEILSK